MHTNTSEYNKLRIPNISWDIKIEKCNSHPC